MTNETIKKVRESIYGQSVENAYKNIVLMSGWVIDQPRIIKHSKTGQESVSFIISQFIRNSNGYAYMKTYHLMSYGAKVIEQIREMKNISFVCCSCELQFNAKTHKYYPQIYEMSVNCVLPYELEKENDYAESKQ